MKLISQDVTSNIDIFHIDQINHQINIKSSCNIEKSELLTLTGLVRIYNTEKSEFSRVYCKVDETYKNSVD